MRQRPISFFSLNNLHFVNSDVDLNDPQHVRQLCRVFHVANENRMAIVVHAHSSVTRKRPYGAKEARIFPNDALPAAPDIPVQIAHLTGAGGYDSSVDEALAVFIDAIRQRDSRMAHVYFDVSGIGQWVEKGTLLATRIRQVGIERILSGPDGSGSGNLSPKEAWAAFRQVPLSDAEFRKIENNITPYMK